MCSEAGAGYTATYIPTFHGSLRTSGQFVQYARVADIEEDVASSAVAFLSREKIIATLTTRVASTLFLDVVSVYAQQTRTGCAKTYINTDAPVSV